MGGAEWQPEALNQTSAPMRLQRRVAFPHGAQALGLVAAGATPSQLPRTAPLRALPRTAPLWIASQEFTAPGIADGTTIAARRRASRFASTTPLRAHLAEAGVQSRHWLLWPMALYLVFNLGDLFSTYMGLRHGLKEGNPLMNAMLTWNGFSAVIDYKLIVTLSVLAGLWLLSGWNIRAARAAMLICNCMVALVVALNLAQYVLFAR